MKTTNQHKQMRDIDNILILYALMDSSVLCDTIYLRYSIVYRFRLLKKVIVLVNSEDSHEMPNDAAFHLDACIYWL